MPSAKKPLLLVPLLEIKHANSRSRFPAKEYNCNRTNLNAKFANISTVNSNIIALLINPIIKMHLHFITIKLKGHIIAPVKPITRNVTISPPRKIACMSLITDCALITYAELINGPDALDLLTILIKKALFKD